MATYTRTVSRISTVQSGQFPAWRSAMTVTDRLYAVSDTGPGWTSNALELPLPSHFGTSDQFTGSGAGWDVISGYSSGTLLEDVGGPWGTMVFGTGGHTRIQNQLLGLNLSTDTPAFSWWQQPQFRTSAGNGAELYYSPSEFNALPANRKILADESVANWDRGFPVGYDGWIFPAKMTTGQLGNNNPHGFRYSTTCFVPASVSGTDSLYFASLGPQGPFVQSWKPTDGPASDWLTPEAMFSNGQQRRYAFYFKNTRTGAWSEHKWQPDVALYGFTRQSCGVFRDLRRVYVSGDEIGRTAGWWYIDMAGGFANLTRSDWFRPSTEVAPNRYSSGAWTDGHPTGRHLAFFADLQNTAGLVVQDFDGNQQYRLNIGQGLNIPANNEQVGMSYDGLRNRILVLLKDPTTQAIYYYAISLPPDPLNAAGYTVSRREVTPDTPAVAALAVDATHFYRKTQLHPTLGVILVPCSRNKMLGFVPGA
jgi:hypothetical protein